MPPEFAGKREAYLDDVAEEIIPALAGEGLVDAVDAFCEGIAFTATEVARVFGKAGRADTSTDPAPFSMMETVVVLKPQNEWRTRERWYSSWMPEFLKPIARPRLS